MHANARDSSSNMWAIHACLPQPSVCFMPCMHGVRTMARQRAKPVMESFGESETELRNIWAAKERAENKRVPSDYDQLRAAFRRYTKGRNNWKQTLLDYREEVRRIRDVASPAKAVKRVRELEPHSPAMPLSLSVTEHPAHPSEASPATPPEAIRDWPGITAAMRPCATPLSERDNEPLLSAMPSSEDALPADERKNVTSGATSDNAK